MKINDYKYIFYFDHHTWQSIEKIRELLLKMNPELDLSEVLFIPNICSLEVILQGPENLLSKFGFE